MESKRLLGWRKRIASVATNITKRALISGNYVFLKQVATALRTEADLLEKRAEKLRINRPDNVQDAGRIKTMTPTATRAFEVIRMDPHGKAAELALKARCAVSTISTMRAMYYRAQGTPERKGGRPKA